VSDRFDELVDHPSLTAEERARLRRVHDLLLDVGPPPEAPRHLSPPAEAQVIPFRRRSRGLALLAAALGAAVLGGAGYLLGERSATPEAAQTVTAERTVTATQATTVRETVTAAPEQPSGPVVRMAGVGAAEGAWATVELLPRAESGDYPVRIHASGLPERTTYEMWVVDDGELEELCGSFTTGYGETEVTLIVPYEMKTRDDWVLVRPGTNEPVLTTA
jgi:hypothetical protein